MEWFAENWVLLLLVGGMAAMHLFGHGHGGHRKKGSGCDSDCDCASRKSGRKEDDPERLAGL